MQGLPLEMAKAEKEEGAERDATQRRHDRVTLEIARLVDTLADPDMPRDQMSTGSFTSFVDPSAKARRSSTGNTTDVCRCNSTDAMSRPSSDLLVLTESIPMSKTSVV